MTRKRTSSPRLQVAADQPETRQPVNQLTSRRPAPAKMEQPWECWHCGTRIPTEPGRCACFCCGDQKVGFMEHGPCQFCVGRLKMAPVVEKLNHYGIDPRDIRHWRYVRDITGGGHRVLDPIYPGEDGR